MTEYTDSETGSAANAATVEGARPWWRDAVFYEIYVRSFADGNGDGVGDLDGIRRHLDHLQRLGVDALWLTPFYPSPQADHGYDVADPRDVDPMFGTLDDFDRLVEDAHARGIRMTIDIVPNHSSSEHPWFRAALAAGPGSPERARYVFRPGRGANGELPPNNWHSTFGGCGWTQVADGDWYLHGFAPEQPDLNWRHPDVPADYERTLRFWLDRGVDGFRIDVAHGLVKAEEFPDAPNGGGIDLMADVLAEHPQWNQPEVHDVFRQWRRVLDSYPGDRMAVGEVWLGDAKQVAGYVRSDELHQAFNFRLVRSSWERDEMRAAIDASIVELAKVGAVPTWVLSNHDVVRHVTRYGGGDIGRRRARAALLLVLGLPGAVYLYQGEELGLEEVDDLPDELLQDPIWERSDHTVRGRDGCRVPLPWSGGPPAFGFSEGESTWLPMPGRWAGHTVSDQAGEASSMLSFYQDALAARRRVLQPANDELTWLDLGADVLALSRSTGHGDVAVIVNFGERELALPAGEVLIRSDDSGLDAALPPDAAAWVRLAD